MVKEKVEGLEIKRTFHLEITFLKHKTKGKSINFKHNAHDLLPRDMAEVILCLDEIKMGLRRLYVASRRIETNGKEEGNNHEQEYIG